mmetsp:Transcript_127412/g.271629  ORF Transcript_127412/g.271629 Transcript_127412/m.271629 type:complete len:212 (+) Transcript_127412:1667-2302(+)
MPFTPRALPSTSTFSPKTQREKRSCGRTWAWAATKRAAQAAAAESLQTRSGPWPSMSPPSQTTSSVRILPDASRRRTTCPGSAAPVSAPAPAILGAARTGSGAKQSPHSFSSPSETSSSSPPAASMSGNACFEGAVLAAGGSSGEAVPGGASSPLRSSMMTRWQASITPTGSLDRCRWRQARHVQRPQTTAPFGSWWQQVVHTNVFQQSPQ